MQDLLAMTYLWLKAGHIIFMVFWLAGLFMLPRQMIYLHPASPGSDESALWAKRMGLLRKVILTPSLIVVWVLGLLLAMTIGAWDQGWFHAKLLFVLLLTAFHGIMVARSKKMIAGDRPMSEKQLRMWGEFPGIMLAIIVILVIVKPF
ncbi:MAG TPA: CopD family protein [Erythrobacter sp.]|jgi:protoporphyrinogen IX oxidase|uniref:Protoporphyrinogen IX oxidase n=2 Tax=Qipengyuania citrea TaxID=225971 RepID=A0A6I4UCC5_9SPHN|nr:MULTISPECIES: CopD family protein [Erythrobacteraceae]MAL54745.1 CopD family protein [Sphingomonadaceae bacterium]MBL4791372.1 CopD family protein [Citromicrobium sp.]MBN90459.1 CopD family protein [Erythrobacteraceae bacterium]RZP18013.1 MAG: CopD family protein [Erythrobacter sp.]KNH00720.1 Membrane protein [Qipengyuania citrea LAMA 915]|tara:strand:+ start:143 stop:586 length:444 start_codon:yes stop_codon:yes gene_type:complete